MPGLINEVPVIREGFLIMSTQRGNKTIMRVVTRRSKYWAT